MAEVGTDSPSIHPDSLISSGSWTLWYHCPEENKWSLSSFTKLYTANTWGEFFEIYELIRNIPSRLTDCRNTSSDIFSDGMFFLMRDPIPPLWENSANIRGGGYSFRITRKDAADVFFVFTVATMAEVLTKNPGNRINGISISPKKGFNIIKIWNTGAEQFNTPTDIRSITKDVRPDDIIYTPFHQKNM